MTREEAIRVLKMLKTECGERAQWVLPLDWGVAFDMAISALSVIEQTKWERDTALATLEEHGIGLGQIAEPSDLISRAEALREMAHAECGVNYEHCCEDDCTCSYIQRILDIPSVSAERVGVWIPSNIPNEKWVCSECGGACWYYDYQGSLGKSNYCPNCGARMRGAE